MARSNKQETKKCEGRGIEVEQKYNNKEVFKILQAEVRLR
jgi:hypothetical protein